MATHQIGKFKFRLSEKGFQYKWGDGSIHTIAFGKAGDEGGDNGRYQGDDSDYAYENQEGYYSDEPSADGYDDGYDYDDQSAEPADGEENEYYGEEQDGQASPVMEYIENNLWVLIALLVILPPAGIYLMWRLNRFEFMHRAAISAASGIWFVVALILIFSSVFGGTQDTSTPPAMTLTSFSPTAKPTDTPTPTPSAEATGDLLNLGAEPSATPIAGDTSGNTGDISADSGNVYSPQTGLYYHKSANCSKIGSNVSVTLVTVEAAKNRNQSACPLCCGGTVYYATASGSRYHTDPNCDGMQNAVEYSKEAAEREGKVACYICAGGTKTDSTDSEDKTKNYAASITNDKSGIKVWMTSSGKAYHASATCSGMSGASEVTLLKALQSGKPACSTCLSYLNSYVYCTSGGTYYHSAATTCGMKNGTRVTLSAALVLGKKKCPDCIDSSLYASGSDKSEGTSSSGSSSEIMVYATANGSYYHTDATCGGMKNASKVTLSAALKAGRPACPVCCPSAEKTVYASSSSKYYHSYAQCGGMTNATSGTLAQALTYGLTACPNCWSSNGTASSDTNTGTNAGANTGTAADSEDGNTGYSGIYVYATETGSAYHASKSCSKLEDGAARVLLEQAIDDGKKPCSSCASYANDKVYGATGNKYFHKTADCSGIVNAKSGTVAEALLHGLEACPICFGADDFKTGESTDGNSGTIGSSFTSGKSGLKVYATTDGKYYHTNMLCSGISGTPVQVTLETALNYDKSACPVCAGSAHRTVYGNVGGKYYHYSSSCAGDSASAGHLDTALALGLKACPNCVAGKTEDGEADISNGDQFVSGTSGINVYAVATGRYYHTSASCGDMTGGQKITLEKALNLGFKACPDCAAVAGRTVYAQKDSSIYHLDADCAGAGCISGTLDKALAYGFKACPVCVTGESGSADSNGQGDGSETSSAPASTRVYIDLSGDSSAFLYHVSSKCAESGMKDGTAVTLEYALDSGYSDCGYCNPPTRIEEVE